MPVTYNQYDAATRTTIRHVDAFKGATLAVWSECIRIMSDVWAHEQRTLVWDEAISQFRVINLDNSEFSSKTQPQHATVDAPAELIARYRDSTITHNYNRLLEAFKAKKEEERKAVHTGSVVLVKRGRKDIGKVGKVVFIKDMPYNAGWRSNLLPKACIALDGQKTTVQGRYGKSFDRYTNTIWVWVKNLDLAREPAPYEVTDEDLARLHTQAVEETDLHLIRWGMKEASWRKPASWLAA
jgi:hypothetical protein